jgi:hypothetical protein
MVRTPPIPVHFDYRPDAIRAGLGTEQLGRLVARFEADYPSDLLLRELHLLRACRAIADGTITLAQAVEPDRPASAA